MVYGCSSFRAGVWVFGWLQSFKTDLTVWRFITRISIPHHRYQSTTWIILYDTVTFIYLGKSDDNDNYALFICSQNGRWLEPAPCCCCWAGEPSCLQKSTHVACRNAPPPAIGVILHEEVCRLAYSSRQDKTIRMFCSIYPLLFHFTDKHENTAVLLTWRMLFSNSECN